MKSSRWSSRAASHSTVEYFPLRSKFIKHSADEHRDFKLLEDNVVSLGGERDESLTHPRNIGSEALSAYRFHSASFFILELLILDGQTWGSDQMVTSGEVA